MALSKKLRKAIEDLNAKLAAAQVVHVIVVSEIAPGKEKSLLAVCGSAKIVGALVGCTSEALHNRYEKSGELEEYMEGVKAGIEHERGLEHGTE